MKEIQCDFEGTKITSTPHNFAVRMQPGKRPGGPKVPGELADHLVPVTQFLGLCSAKEDMKEYERGVFPISHITISKLLRMQIESYNSKLICL